MKITTTHYDVIHGKNTQHTIMQYNIPHHDNTPHTTTHHTSIQDIIM